MPGIGLTDFSFRPSDRMDAVPRLKKGIVGQLFDAIAFVVPAMLFLEVNIVGRLFISELLLLALLPVLVALRGRLLLQKTLVLFVLLGLLWLMGQIGTDLYRNTPFVDYARGWAKIAFTLLNFLSLYLLLFKDSRRLKLFALGWAAGVLMLFIFNPSELGMSQPWKFGLGLSLVLGTLITLQHRAAQIIPLLPSIALVLIGVFFLFQGFRSGAGIAILSAVAIAASQYFYSHVNETRVLQVFVFCILCLIAGYGILEGYSQAASSGFLGAGSKLIYEQQSLTDMGLFLGSRSGILVTMQAIIDSPIIGHGSWAKNPDYSYLMALILYGHTGREIPVLAHDLIPTHSVFLGSWVEAGFVGGLFWAAVIYTGFKAVVKLSASGDGIVPLGMFLGILFFWDVLFSPFGAFRRIELPYMMVLFVSINAGMLRDQLQTKFGRT